MAGGGFSIVLRPAIDYSDLYVLALINSSALFYYLKSISNVFRGGWITCTKQYFEQLPIHRIGFTTSTADRQRYAEAGRQLYEQFWAKNDYPGVRGFVAQHLAVGRSDVVHDLLARLAERMIAMHKEKQEYQRLFRLDLAGYLDERQMGKLHRLYTPKKPPQEGGKDYASRLASHEQAVQLAQAQLGPLAGETLDLEGFWRLNQAQWMWLLRQNLGQVDDMSKLVGIYQHYHERVAPLMACIQRTDWLIDQVVYQLYSLTEEEIAVVEGRTHG